MYIQIFFLLNSQEYPRFFSVTTDTQTDRHTDTRRTLSSLVYRILFSVFEIPRVLPVDCENPCIWT